MVAVLKNTIHFRDMCLADIDNIMAVETSNYDFPWSKQIFLDCIKVGYLCRVMENAQGEFIAYAIMTAAAEESHILNISIAPNFQGQGYGRDFMHFLLEEAKGHGSKDIILEVRPSNQIALKLYYSMGFMQIGLRQNYYKSYDGREDALVMLLNLT